MRTTRTPDLMIQSQLFRIHTKKEATWNMLREGKKRNEEKIKREVKRIDSRDFLKLIVNPKKYIFQFDDACLLQA